MEGLSPRDIIAQLDVEEIDQAIDDLKEELSALQSLRKVALAKNGKAPARTAGRGKSSRTESSSDKIETAIQVLERWGSMDYRKLAERSGYATGREHWLLKKVEKDSRFSVQGEIVSLASTD